MIQSERLLNAFDKLSKELLLLDGPESSDPVEHLYGPVIQNAAKANPWFIPEFTRNALINTGRYLSGRNLDRWLEPYTDRLHSGPPKTIGVVMAGNIPLVGFSDLLCVLFSGNRFMGKLSSNDRVLIPFIAERLCSWLPELSDAIHFTEEKLSGFDGIIATGSNNTARYFEYYFRKYPHIIRKNRNGIAVLTGDESEEDLNGLAEDVFLYFGLGCRNVSKLYVPKGYEFNRLLDVFSTFGFLKEHSKYMNNHDYYRSIFLINKIPHLDNGFVMLTEETAMASPPSVLFYEEYGEVESLSRNLDCREEEIQCIVSGYSELRRTIPFGSAQKPALWDYADGVDTMDFLLEMKD